MKRLLGSNWKRIGLQVGLLAGIGLAFAMGTQPEPATAGGMAMCPSEGECTFKKPNIMFIMDYSTSMNNLWDMDNNLTRWQVTVAAVQQVTAPGSFLSQNTHIALTRFGHDPNGGAEGTSIGGDTSGIIDGQALDVPWDDADTNEYFNCAGATINDSLAATPAPMDGDLTGIGTWTKGALDFVSTEIATTKADHPDDQLDAPRSYVNVLLTDGEWTGINGTTPLEPASQNPAITAQALFDDQNIRTYVVAVAGDPDAEAAADETAAAGGTTEAIYGGTPEELEMALASIVTNIIDSVVAPECIGGLPRVMILLDASSSMLNINGGEAFGGMGETGWDRARDALSGQSSLFDVDVGIGTVEDISHLGLAVFGHNEPAPGEQKILVNYGPCMKDNFGWALDPQSSCVAPGCDDPWGGPPITWTFQDGTQDPPGFDQATDSHMPKCNGDVFCSGSGTYTHLGLQLIKNNQIQYQTDGLDPMAQYPTKPETIYFNILITDGQYNGYSTNGQVQAELEAMYGSGITTYVIGFGDGVDTQAAIDQLDNMAGWGSGDTENYFDANNQDELELALASIFTNLVFDPCCALNDCSENPEPTTMDPDPIPNPDTGDGDGDPGDGDGDPGDGDGDPTTGDGDGDPTTGDGDGDPTTGDGDGDPDPTTGDGDPDPTTTGDEIGDEDTGETGETGGPSGGDLGEDDGCNCSTDGDTDKTRGLLGAFLALGLAGFVRRRRRD